MLARVPKHTKSVPQHLNMNVTEKLISSHRVDGTMKAGEEIGLAIDQTLNQDATGTLVMLELAAMELERVKTDLSVQYVDHNLLQEDFKNPDDHFFLQSACRKFGLWFSRRGNGVSLSARSLRLACWMQQQVIVASGQAIKSISNLLKK